MLSLAIDAEMAPNAVSNLYSILSSLFTGIPNSYRFFIYFVMVFMVCLSFKFLIDFLKIVFSLIFNKGGF